MKDTKTVPKIRKHRFQNMYSYYNKAEKTALDFATKPLPKSLDWIYGFGFKVGIFLALKSFLALRFFHLSLSGCLMVLSQLIMALAFIVSGLIMQRPGSIFDLQTLRISTISYGSVTIYSALICIIKANFDLDFFRKAASKNWFVDFFNGLSKVLGEISMSIVFWDIDLWTMFSLILLLLTIVSHKIAYPNLKLLASEDAKQMPDQAA